MSYVKTIWSNNTPPALNAINLNHIEDGIYYSLAHSGGIRNSAEFLEKNPGSSTAGIQEAINVGPGIVFIPAGTHNISTAILIQDRSNIMLRGAGQEATIINNTNAAGGHGIHIKNTGASNHQNIAVTDLKVLGTAGGGDGIRVEATGAGGFVEIDVEQCKVTTSQIGIHFVSGTVSCRLVNNWIEANRSDGIRLAGTNGTTLLIESCWIKSNGSGGTGWDINISTAWNTVTIKNAICESTASGGIYALNCMSLTIEDSHIEAMTGASPGIRISGGNGRIVGCYFAVLTTAIDFANTASTFEISGNYGTVSVTTGVAYGTSAGIYTLFNNKWDGTPESGGASAHISRIPAPYKITAEALWDIGSGATKVSIASRYHAWEFANAAEQYAGGLFPCFTASGTIIVRFYWTRVGAEAAGNVRWRCLIKDIADGGDLTAADTELADTIAAPTQNCLKINSFSTTFAYTAGEAPGIRIGRVGADAADTFTGVVDLLAVELELI